MGLGKGMRALPLMLSLIAGGVPATQPLPFEDAKGTVYEENNNF